MNRKTSKRVVLAVLVALLAVSCVDNHRYLQKQIFITVEGDTIVHWGGQYLHYTDSRIRIIVPY